MTGKQKSKTFGWRWRLTCLALLLLVTFIVVAGTWPEKFLLVEQKPAKADAMVLLGGGITFRVPRALELFQQQLAPTIIITGEGDADEMQRWLSEKGVSAQAMQCETNSRNTWQNASFSVPLLRAARAKRVLVVTSWFHSRRALACFRKAAPDMEFISVPTKADRPEARALEKKERGMVLYEYIKLAGYWVRYGVNPF